MRVLTWELDIRMLCHHALFTSISTHDGDQIWDQLNEYTMQKFLFASLQVLPVL